MTDREAAAGLVERARHMLNEYPLCNFERLVVADLLSELERVGKERDEAHGRRQEWTRKAYRAVTAKSFAEKRATKAEALVAEAVRVYEPFKRMADMEERTVEHASVIINVNHLRAIGAFIEKAKES